MGMPASDQDYINETHMCEEVPGVPDVEKFFIWHKLAIVWKGPTKESGYEWAKANGVEIANFYPFEP